MRQNAVAQPSIVFVIDSWSSEKGGIQTYNRELCLAVAAHCQAASLAYDVVCVVGGDLDSNDVLEANRAGVRLVEGFVRFDRSGRYYTNVVAPGLAALDIRVVVGHSRFTARAALDLARRCASGGPSPKVAYIYHMHADELEGLKRFGNGPVGDLRTLEEVGDVADKCDVLFAVGPRLKAQLEDWTHETVIALTGGIRECVEPPKPGNQPVVLCFGRVQDEFIKGFDLVRAAFALLLKTWSATGAHFLPKLVILGAPEDQRAQLERQWVEEIMHNADDRRAAQVQVHAYTSDPLAVMRHIQDASVVVMPSIAEGYGLVALEALARGKPFVATYHSGVAYLMDSLGYSMASARGVCLVDAQLRGAAEELRDALLVHTDPRFAAQSRANVRELQSLLCGPCLWSSAAANMLKALEL